jgi:hypothetical protein
MFTIVCQCGCSSISALADGFSLHLIERLTPLYLFASLIVPATVVMWQEDRALMLTAPSEVVAPEAVQREGGRAAGPALKV